MVQQTRCVCVCGDCGAGDYRPNWRTDVSCRHLWRRLPFSAAPSQNSALFLSFLSSPSIPLSTFTFLVPYSHILLLCTFPITIKKSETTFSLISPPRTKHLTYTSHTPNTHTSHTTHTPPLLITHLSLSLSPLITHLLHHLFTHLSQLIPPYLHNHSHNTPYIPSKKSYLVSLSHLSSPFHHSLHHSFPHSPLLPL